MILLPYTTSDVLTARHCFLTRLGGVSEGIYSSLNLRKSSDDAPENVKENYRRVRELLGVERMVFSHQVHGATVRPVTSADAREPYEPTGYDADGLITNEPGLALMIFTADCIPILMHDPVTRSVAAVHAGWRGTVADIAGEAVRQFVRLYGARPGDIEAAVGPGIGFMSYETDSEVRDAVLGLLPESPDFILPSENEGHWYLDLKEVNRRLLLRAGVTKISVAPEDTFAMPERYWSHRYTKGQRGVQGSGIVNEILEISN